jgi:hypothetical protein
VGLVLLDPLSLLIRVQTACSSTFAPNMTSTDPNDWVMAIYAQYFQFVYVSVACLCIFLRRCDAAAIPHAHLQVVSLAFCYRRVQSIPNNGTLTQSYETAAQYLCRFQVTLGGYRLAAKLESIFNSDSYVDVLPSRLRGAEPSSKF